MSLEGWQVEGVRTRVRTMECVVHMATHSFVYAGFADHSCVTVLNMKGLQRD